MSDDQTTEEIMADALASLGYQNLASELLKQGVERKARAQGRPPTISDELGPRLGEALRDKYGDTDS